MAAFAKHPCGASRRRLLRRHWLRRLRAATSRGSVKLPSAGLATRVAKHSRIDAMRRRYGASKRAFIAPTSSRCSSWTSSRCSVGKQLLFSVLSSLLSSPQDICLFCTKSNGCKISCPLMELIMKKFSNRTRGKGIFVCYLIDPQNNQILGPGRGLVEAATSRHRPFRAHESPKIQASPWDKPLRLAWRLSGERLSVQGHRDMRRLRWNSSAVKGCVIINTC
jgi:hypothetical protein